ncbi:MAG: hypothetical protein IJ273_01860 [Alphaproteobacteria bacterium]|nr:hypothetical protein [Alphaproteobacteria bacterium]
MRSIKSSVFCSSAAPLSMMFCNGVAVLSGFAVCVAEGIGDLPAPADVSAPPFVPDVMHTNNTAINTAMAMNAMTLMIPAAGDPAAFLLFVLLFQR